MKIKLAPLAICLAFGLSAVAGPAQAKNWLYYLMQQKKNKEEEPVTLPVETPGNSNPPGHSSSYPNGRPWQAVRYDFIDVKKRIAEVKEDTEEILTELDDIDADLGDLLDGQEDLMDGQDALMDGQDALSDQIDDLAGAVEAQGNVLEVQARVGAISEDGASIDSSDVVLYVQVIQNGAGVTGLAAGEFSYANVDPSAEAATYCGADVCFEEREGSNGLYILTLDAGGAGNYAGTVAVAPDEVSIDATGATGTSIVSFEIEEPDVSIDPV